MENRRRIALLCGSDGPWAPGGIYVFENKHIVFKFGYYSEQIYPFHKLCLKTLGGFVGELGEVQNHSYYQYTRPARDVCRGKGMARPVTGAECTGSGDAVSIAAQAPLAL